MPQYEITSPDGHTYQVTAPDGASQGDVMKYVQQQHALAAPASSQPQVGGLEAGLRNAANAATFNLMPMIAAAGDAAIPLDSNSSRAETFGQRYQENLQNQRKQDAAAQSQHPVASLAGSVGGGFLNPVTRALPAARSLAGAIGQGAGIGAGYGIGAGLTNQDDTEKLAKDALLGGATGAATGAAFHGLGRLLAPAQKTAAAQDLEARGVTPTIGQSLGGSAQRLEDSMTSVPFVGDAIKRRQMDAITGFNRAAYDEVLQPLGVQYPKSGPVGNDGISRMSNIIGKAYDAAYNGAKVKNDQGLQADIQAALDDASFKLPADRHAMLQKYVDGRINANFNQNGELSGDVLQSIKNGLSQRARSLASAADPEQRDMGDAYGAILDALKGNIARNDPNKGALLQAADDAYSRFVRVSSAASSNNASAKEGIFSANQLGTAARAADSSVRKGAYAKGDALMQDLAQAGQKTLSATVPDSGTGLRTFIPRIATALGLGGAGIVSAPAAATIAAPLAGGTALYSKQGQELAKALLFGAPQTRTALSKIPPHMLAGALGLIGSQTPTQ